jgi:signal transduction histidine kinase
MKGIKGSLERLNTQREQVVEEEKQYVRNLTFLARTATKFVELSPDEDIYQFIGEELRNFIGNSVVLISSFEKAPNRLRVRAISGIEKYMGSILKILGRIPVMMSVTANEETLPDITSGQLVKISGGLYELSFGEIPEAVCHAVEKLLNLGDIYGMGFMKEGKLFGVAVIMMRKGNALRAQSTIETFINQVSVVLQRRRAEKALCIAEANFRNVIEKNADAIFVVDKEKIVRFVNPAAEVVLGHKKGELVGKTFGFPVVPGETTEIDIVRNGIESLTAEMRVVEAEWEERNVYVASLRDTTERKLLEAQLLQSEKLAAIGELVSGVAHEINNPLTGIIGLSQMLKQEADGLDMEQKKQLEIICSEGMRLKKIVSSLLSFARKQKPEKKQVIVNQLLENVLEMKNHELNITNIKVVRDFAEPMPFVEVDSQQIEQVLLNIINNAQQAMSKAHNRGTLTVRVYREDNILKIELMDDGPGIPKENLKKIFDPFFTTKEEGKGTGLGLSISYGIIKEHNGNLFAQSEEEKGTKFTIELPIV